MIAARSLRKLALTILILAPTASQAQQVDYLIDKKTGQVSTHLAVEFEKPLGEHVTICSMQSPQGGVANVVAEADIYRAPNNEPLTYSVFLNFNSTTGSIFPGVMMADNMGLGAGYAPGVDTISSYDALFFRSSSDPQPGLADFHMALWDGDPLCAIDTPGNGFLCAPITGTEAEFVDIPAATQFTATHILPKGVTSPNQRVWMVVSGSQTGVNPSPCRLGLDNAYGPAIIGDNNITGNPTADDFFMTQQDDNNGIDGAGAEGTCCVDGSTCSAAALCSSDTAGTRGHCYDDFAESPNLFGIATGAGTRCDMYAGSQCANFTAGVRAPANTVISMIPIGTNKGTIEGNEILLPDGPADMDFEVRFSTWDPHNEGTMLKAWEADTSDESFYDGLQGYLSPSMFPCSTDLDCRALLGGICSISGNACVQNSDCPFAPSEFCGGSTCSWPNFGPDAGTMCQPGYITTGRTDYVYYGIADLASVDTNLSYFRYASAVQNGPGTPPPDPFPSDGAYAGTMHLYASADCKGTFDVGFFPPPRSVLVNQDNEFIPLIGFSPAKVTCEIGSCCINLTSTGGCWPNVTRAQCASASSSFWTNILSCDDNCQCFGDSDCQDGSWCNGTEACDHTFHLCDPGTPPDCDDGIACTDDFCVEDGENNGHCDNIPDHSSCDDGLWCTGVESCDGSVGCVSLSPPCDDGITCTIDTCDEAGQSCGNTPDNAACDNGLFCDGIETCDAATGCQPGTNPCGGATCDEINDTCDTGDIPAVSTWGLIALALLLIAGCKITFQMTSIRSTDRLE